MTKQLTNKLKWIGQLLLLGEFVDPETDRVGYDYILKRNIRYNNIGVTSTDKQLGERDTSEVMLKIEIRVDREIEDNQKEYRIKIRDRVYNIERIYTREEDRVMEVSLSYAD